MKQITFTIILIFVFCFVTFAPVESSQILITDPDVFYKISWKDEGRQLDHLADNIRKDENKIGLVVIRFDKKTKKYQVKNRLNQIESYLIKNQKICRNQFKIIVANMSEEEITSMYWIVDKSETPEK